LYPGLALEVFASHIPKESGMERVDLSEPIGRIFVRSEFMMDVKEGEEAKN